MATEIEVKLSLDKKSFSKFMKWLKENAKEKEPIIHDEYYFNNPKDPFKYKDDEGYIDAMDFMRVRFSEKGDSICLKKFYPDPERPGFTTHCDEYEFNVSDGKVAMEFLKALGYDDVTKMKKSRRKFEFENFEIVVDEVEDLDTFIEVEIKSEENDPKFARKKIDEFIKGIGIKKYREHRRGYISMLWNDKYDFGSDVIL